ncbi:hypothetical protein [uncultured Hyphomicrobium sp.]|uniref:hypothetical protein n=1 Tax=uncultured Hyphomicrobium sp. TaxID=194373 RepID=UPI0025DE9A4C|nr:hypothetical protein [uncultured Hyphomicrobium sp.]
MGRWKNTPAREIEWNAKKANEFAELSARRAKLDCVEQAMTKARIYEATNSREGRIKAEVLREFAEALMR